MTMGVLSDAQYQEVLRGIRKRREDNFRQGMRMLMQKRWGRDLMRSLIYEHSGRLLDASYTPGESTEQTLYREGQRSVARAILNTLDDVAPKEKVLMEREAADARLEEMESKTKAKREHDDRSREDG